MFKEFKMVVENKKPIRRWIREKGKELLCSTSGAGGAFDIAIELAVGVIVGAAILVALKQLFNVNILPSVTDKITGMFS